MTIDIGNETDPQISAIEQALLSKWFLGRNLVLCWSANRRGIDFLAVPYYMIGVLISEENDTEDPDRPTEAKMDKDITSREIIKGSRLVNGALMKRLEQQYTITRDHLPLAGAVKLAKERVDEIDELIRRYSISYVENHAVALFDIVGFSRYSPFDQVTLLSSLSYSINSTYNKLLAQGINVGFARTTTGDGFYVWTREPTIEGNVNLYSLVQLVLADNAIARTKSYGRTAPILKTAFHIGNYYEFYQAEALRPTQYSYIVGDVTIELARIIEKASPGQVLIGDFNCRLPLPDQPGVDVDVGTVDFINLLNERIQALKGVRMSDKEIVSVICYLTGQRMGDTDFSISRYRVVDKHKRARTVYNAKLNIYRDDGPPIYLGIQEQDVQLSASGPRQVAERRADLRDR